jgi:uncharacterized membrane protein YuzA (DUF378 family)
MNDLNVYKSGRAAGGERSLFEVHPMKAFGLIALILVVVGAVNWGLVGLAQFDLVATLFGGQSAPLSRVVYGLVGLAGLALLALQLAPPPATHPAHRV